MKDVRVFLFWTDIETKLVCFSEENGLQIVGYGFPAPWGVQDVSGCQWNTFNCPCEKNLPERV